MGYRKGPDIWQAASKMERLKNNPEAATVPDESTITMTQRLNLATMNQSLPFIDLHGKTTEDVEFEIDTLLAENPGTCVRIIYGNGSGRMSTAVLKYLHRLLKSRAQTIGGFQEDPRRASCVVYVN